MINKLLYLKSLHLKNFCQYKDYTFNFCKSNGKPYPFVCFFGPNGVNKTMTLNSINLLTMNTAGRPEDRIKSSLMQYVRNEDYDPLMDKSRIQAKDMLIEGVFSMNGEEYTVQLTENGFIRNDLAPIVPKDTIIENALETLRSGPWGEKHLKYRERIAHFITTDNDLSMNKFQIHASQIKNFETIISEITRYPVECIKPSGTTDGDFEFCTDFVLIKPDHRVHYKRMSAGERKICKSFSMVLNLIQGLENPSYGEEAMEGWPRLLLLDNVEMHVYYDRHVTLVECLKRVFNKQQIFATTHSGTLIQRHLAGENDEKNELWIDLEKVQLSQSES